MAIVCTAMKQNHRQEHCQNLTGYPYRAELQAAVEVEDDDCSDGVDCVGPYLETESGPQLSVR